MFAFISACAPDIEKVNQLSVNPESVAEAGRGVEMLYSENGILKARIEAPMMLSHQQEEPHTEFPEGVKLFFFNEKMDTTSTMTADYGKYYTQKEEMNVRDNVVIVNDKGEMLNSEELIWRRKEKKIHSDKYVRITTPEEIIYGTGFEANEDFSDYTIKKISGVIKVEE